MREARAVEPCLVIESNRVDHQRVSFPPADRVAHPRGIQIFGVLVGAGGINLPHKVIELEEFDYTAWRLNDLERKGMHVDSRHTGWEASNFVACSWVHEIGGILHCSRSPGRLRGFVERFSPGRNFRNSTDNRIPAPPPSGGEVR